MNKFKKIKLIGTGAVFGTIAVLSGAMLIRKKITKKKIQKLIENENYSTGNTREFGTMYLDGEKQKLPVDFLEFQDVPVYAGQKIEIKDTDKRVENKLSWIEINDNDKKLLVCDRNILKDVSWNELNEQNLIFGKVVIIDGKKYILRLLTGYSEKKDYKTNEWDRYIANIDNIMEILIDTNNEIDNSSDEENKEKINEDSNNLWHWSNFSSFTQNEWLKSEKLCIARGFYSITYFNKLDKELRYETVGYRPVLELIE